MTKYLVQIMDVKEVFIVFLKDFFRISASYKNPLFVSLGSVLLFIGVVIFLFFPTDARAQKLIGIAMLILIWILALNYKSFDAAHIDTDPSVDSNNALGSVIGNYFLLIARMLLICFVLIFFIKICTLIVESYKNRAVSMSILLEIPPWHRGFLINVCMMVSFSLFASIIKRVSKFQLNPDLVNKLITREKGNYEKIGEILKETLESSDNDEINTKINAAVRAYLIPFRPYESQIIKMDEPQFKLYNCFSKVELNKFLSAILNNLPTKLTLKKHDILLLLNLNHSVSEDDKKTLSREEFVKKERISIVLENFQKLITFKEDENGNQHAYFDNTLLTSNMAGQEGDRYPIKSIRSIIDHNNEIYFAYTNWITIICNELKNNIGSCFSVLNFSKNWFVHGTSLFVGLLIVVIYYFLILTIRPNISLSSMLTSTNQIAFACILTFYIIYFFRS